MNPEVIGPLLNLQTAPQRGRGRVYGAHLTDRPRPPSPLRSDPAGGTLWWHPAYFASHKIQKNPKLSITSGINTMADSWNLPTDHTEFTGRFCAFGDANRLVQTGAGCI